jgi:hypothetical protein
MKALTFVEIDIDYCSLTYGTAPCTAALGVTGSDRCYNTIATCQARAAFDNVPVTLRFAIDTLALPESGIEALPYLTAVNYTPPTISLGKDLGTRASVTANFMDRPHPDTGAGFDKYLSQRAYADPFYRGTFFGKFATRQKYIKGRPFRLIQGYLGQAIGDMETRHFVIESFTGPDRQGNYSITAKDALKLVDGDRAQAPVLSLGYLSSDITNIATSATLLPSGIGNASYPASGYVNIGGKEICSFTRSDDVLTLTRAQFNTTAQAHRAEDRAQLCIYYNGESPADVIYDLLTTYADVPTAYIPLADWQDEIDNYYNRQITAILPDPTSVKDLVAEIIEQVGLAIWWDDQNEVISLQVLQEATIISYEYNEENILEGSLQIKEQPEKRISQVWNYYGQINPLKSISDIDNYRSTLATVDAQSQSDYGQAAIKKIYSRWIPELAQIVASRVNSIQISRFVNPPRRISLSIFRTTSAGDVPVPQFGQYYQIKGKSIQDASGLEVSLVAQVTRINPHADRVDVELEESTWTIIQAEDLSRRTLTVTADTNNINLKSAHDQIYPEIDDGDEVQLVVQTGAKVGSTSTGTYSVDIGTWPSTARTATRTSASPTLTSVSGDLSILKAGMRVIGTGIPSGTVIDSVDVGLSTVTLSDNATSSGAAGAITIYTVIIKLILRGSIYAAGGAGGWNANFGGNAGSGNKNGSPGGPAVYTRYPINIDFGTGAVIAGGGGGGGSSACQDFDDHRGGAGGGGSGFSAVGPGGIADGGGEAGAAGTLTGGGIGGRAYTSTAFFGIGGPSYQSGRGGTGGSPGAAGGSGAISGTWSIPAGSGGAGGTSVDGISWVKVTSGTATYNGPTSN